MNTVSIAFPVPTSSSHLRVPSVAAVSSSTGGAATVASRARRSRNGLDTSVMALKSSTPAWCIQRISCRARYGFSPRPAQ
jgi:hypothetical protein